MSSNTKAHWLWIIPGDTMHRSTVCVVIVDFENSGLGGVIGRS